MAGAPPSDWNDQDKSTVVEQLLLKKLTLREACMRHNLSEDELGQWVRIFRRTVSDAVDEQLRSTLGVQGLKVAELSSSGLAGKIGDIAIADLLQTLQMGKKNAHLTVTHETHEHHIWCSKGEVVDAQSLSLTGKEALYRILGIDSGHIAVAFLSQPPPRRMDVCNQGLLLAAADRATLHEKLLGRLGGALRCYRTAAATSKSDLDNSELQILEFTGRPLNVKQLQEMSSLGDVPTLRAVEKLLASGHIEIAPSSSVPAARIASQYSPHPAGSPSLFRVTSAPLNSSKRPPVWLLAGGATLCMSMGAASALTVLRNFDNVTETTAQPGIAIDTDDCPSGMVSVSAGSFEMGTHSSSPTLSMSRPTHVVSIRRFCMATHETTVAEYSRCVAAGDCTPGYLYSGLQADQPTAVLSTSEAAHAEQCNSAQDDRQSHPINCVSQMQASEYCGWASSRLPTEAEWEFAARGPESRIYPWGSTAPSSAHVNACGKECQRWHEELGLEDELQGQAYPGDDGYAGTAPVGSFAQGATPEGIFDMLGNVFEWTSGGLYAYSSEDQHNPAGPRETDAHVIRGGNFKSGLTEFTDPTVRFAIDSNSHLHGIGFRCATDKATDGLAMNP